MELTHSDDRRDLYSWPEAKMIKVKRNTTIGKHYHKKKEELFILTSGVGLLYWGKPNGPRDVIEMERGTIYTIPPNTYHEFHLLEGAILIGLNSNPYDPTDDYRE